MKHNKPGRNTCFGRSFTLVCAGTAAAAFGQPTFAQDAQGDVISLTAGISLTRDSNVARVPDNFDVSQFGASSRGDTYLKGSLGVNFDRQISQQRITANAQVDGFKYNDYSDFDNIGYRAGVNYDWVIGRPFFGTVGFNLYRFEPAVQDNLTVAGGKPVRNQIDRQFLYLSGGMRFTPSWSVIARADFDRRRNSLETSKLADNDQNGYEIGTRYAPGTGTEVDFVYRRVAGDYLNLQTQTINGEPIFATSNDFKQDELLARIRYRPSEDSLLSGRIGLTKRSYDQAGDQRDFNGLTTGFEVAWAPTGATTMRVSLARDIAPQDVTSSVASYADTTLLALRPEIRITGKITLKPFFEYYDIKYKGEVSEAAAGRKDTLQNLGLGVNYEFRRNLNIIADLRREERSSNRAGADFTANVFTVGLQARF